MLHLGDYGIHPVGNFIFVMWDQSHWEYNPWDVGINPLESFKLEVYSSFFISVCVINRVVEFNLPNVWINGRKSLVFTISGTSCSA